MYCVKAQRGNRIMGKEGYFLEIIPLKELLSIILREEDQLRLDRSWKLPVLKHVCPEVFSYLGKEVRAWVT
jgi:hypothetical protein